MTPYYEHAGVALYVGDCLAVLPQLEAESVQTCVTSPPYFGLRDYGTAAWDGGDAGCAHVCGGQVSDSKAPGAIASGIRPGADASRCRRCGARRIDAQIGLEPTPTAYVDQLVVVFREVRRVLKADGTLWLVLGDSYAGAGYSNHANTGGAQREDGGKQHHTASFRAGNPDKNGGVQSIAGCKPKDLIGIPWRVAFALQADGWWLRSDIIWAKPAPMPESVHDRPTRAHEYLFLLAKSERYFYDAAAIAERSINAGSVVSLGAKSLSRGLATAQAVAPSGNGKAAAVTVTETRNKRSVWTVASEPFPEAHFATFPPALITPCILAGSRPGDTVLDPFGGAGTALMVAKHLNRRAVGIDLNSTYAAMAARRLAQDVLPLEMTS